jgi:hypothetical protein
MRRQPNKHKKERGSQKGKGKKRKDPKQDTRMKRERNKTWTTLRVRAPEDL